MRPLRTSSTAVWNCCRSAAACRPGRRVRLRHDLAEQLAFVDRQCQRLFGVDVLAGPAGGDVDRRVPMVGRAVDNDVDVLVVEQPCGSPDRRPPCRRTPRGPVRRGAGRRRRRPRYRRTAPPIWHRPSHGRRRRCTRIWGRSLADRCHLAPHGDPRSGRECGRCDGASRALVQELAAVEWDVTCDLLNVSNSDAAGV